MQGLPDRCAFIMFMHVYWLAFQEETSCPRDDRTGHAGHKAYEIFLAEARKDVKGKRLVVPATGSRSSQDKAEAKKKKKKKET